MIPSLSFEELNRRLSEKYEHGERRIVGLMLARYDIPVINEIISSCYQYWHKNSGRDFDLFWAGYGEYFRPDADSPTQYHVDFRGNDTNVFFDLDALPFMVSSARRVWHFSRRMPFMYRHRTI